MLTRINKLSSLPYVFKTYLAGFLSLELADAHKQLIVTLSRHSNPHQVSYKRVLLKDLRLSMLYH